MDEPKNQPPPAVTRPPVIASGARLTPLQEAWSDYVDHAIACADCRHIGRQRCDESDRLYGEYQAMGAAARGVRVAPDPPVSTS